MHAQGLTTTNYIEILPLSRQGYIHGNVWLACTPVLKVLHHLARLIILFRVGKSGFVGDIGNNVINKN